MSWQACAWAVRQVARSGAAKAVLLVLAEAADKDSGETFLGLDEIAKRASISRRAVVDHMRGLVDDGLMTRERRVDARGWRKSDLIRLQMGEGLGANSAPREVIQGADVAPRTGPQGANPAPREGAQGAEIDMSKVQISSCLGAGSAPEPIREPIIEPVSAPQASRRKPETKVPEGFPGEREIAEAEAMAERAGVKLDLAQAAFRFRTHAEQNDRRLRDWPAGWRMWINKDIARLPKAQATVVAAEAPDDWSRRLRGYRANAYWNVGDWGPKPGKPGCRAPASLLIEFGFDRAAA
jgi:hypothetical protein